MKQASGSLSPFFLLFSKKKKKKFLLRGYMYIEMDVALHEKTPRSGYENEEINCSMKIISSVSLDAFIARIVARVYVFCPHISYRLRVYVLFFTFSSFFF